MFGCGLSTAPLHLFILLATLSCSTQALIVPQELPSVLSLIYSNIPPIRKGTDSRLGFGFRLGEHADFQVVVELGPQRETQPLGMSSASSKRQVNQNDFKRTPTPTIDEPSTPAPSWLQSWSNDMHAKKKKLTQNRPTENIIKKAHIKMLPESSLKQLQQLYKMATTTMEPIVVEDTVEPAVISPRQAQTKLRKTKGEITEELMDVDLE